MTVFLLIQLIACRLSAEASRPLHPVLRLVQLHHHSSRGQVIDRGGCVPHSTCPRYVAIFYPMKHLSHNYRQGLLALITSNWVSGKLLEDKYHVTRSSAGLVLGAWQGAVHHAGPVSCHQHDQDYFLCGANTEVAKGCNIPENFLIN